MTSRNIGKIGGAALGGFLLLAGNAYAEPVFTAGSFAFSGITNNTSDVTTTTNFPLSPESVSLGGAATGDFSMVALPSSLSLTGAADFANPATFNFSDAELGSFSADTASLLSSVSGTNAAASWDVRGTFTLGSAFDNAGTVLTANETWSLTQTGGAGKAISISGTFNAPATAANGVPEPASLALLGAGLAGVGATARVRRKKKRN